MKLIISANRLPVTVKKNAVGQFDYKRIDGGLVTGIDSLRSSMDFAWFGNISSSLTEEEKTRISSDLIKTYQSHPVFIDPELNSLCYDGFCNSILWPALHSFPDNVCFTFKEYDAYKKYNRIFAEKIAAVMDEDDIVWIHDYHQMLVPRYLKELKPHVKILFFSHTAFCEPENLDRLLCARDLLNSLSLCDVVGFHTPEYASNFSLSLDSYKIGRIPKIKAISIGIEPGMFRSCLEKEETKAAIRRLRKCYKNKRIILGVDRADYIKGMPQRFKGIERFYQRNKKAVSEVVFLQISIPSRLGVQEYAGYVEQINRQIEHINSTMGRMEDTPIQMLFHGVTFIELCALYSIADAILITSVVDGMNLVAMEYVACQDENEGTVILSEHTGATVTLQGVFVHDSNNTESIAEAVEMSLNLTKEQRKINHETNRKAIDAFNSIGWASESLDCVSESWRGEIFKKQ
ncbi:TPS1 [Enterospora canceri]|uniref:TPS1 n=1 Tax=Enterospora canceri TaxID=1081671 RepID=A0A1Y1S6P9_9MICR|nr:TPS1 [Enterospora canceri]